MENKKPENNNLFTKDEIYFLVYFSNFLIGFQILCLRYSFISIYSFFASASLEPYPFILLYLVFFCSLYYLCKIIRKRHLIRNFINFIKDCINFKA